MEATKELVVKNGGLQCFSLTSVFRVSKSHQVSTSYTTVPRKAILRLQSHPRTKTRLSSRSTKWSLQIRASRSDTQCKMQLGKIIDYSKTNWLQINYSIKTYSNNLDSAIFRLLSRIIDWMRSRHRALIWGKFLKVHLISLLACYLEPTWKVRT